MPGVETSLIHQIHDSHHIYFGEAVIARACSVPGTYMEYVPNYTGGSCSVNSKYPTEVLGKLRYGLNTVPNTPVRFGTNSTQVPEKFGTTSIPVPDNSVRSVRLQYTGTGQFGKGIPGVYTLPKWFLPGLFAIRVTWCSNLVGRVRSGQEFFKSHGSGRVGSGRVKR